MKRDKQRRETLSRVDDHHRKWAVELARKWIYEKGIRPGSKAIARILDPKSLTPNRVCIQSILQLFVCLNSIRTLSRNVLGLMDLTFTLSSLSIFCMNLNWASGRQHFHTSSGSSMLKVEIAFQHSMNGMYNQYLGLY
jgi:hypothetical protein